MFLETWEKTKDKIHNLDHYRRAALVAMTLAVGFIILFLTAGLACDLFCGSLFLDILQTVSFFAHILSSITYIAGVADLRNKADCTLERWVTAAMIVVALGIVAWLSLLSMPLSLFSFVSMATTLVGALAGIGSRLSGITRRLLAEQYALMAAAVVGALMSGTWLLLSPTTIVHIVGVITFTTGSTVFLPAVSAIIFFLLFTSACMSGADYLTKGGYYLYNLFNPTVIPCTRHHEYEGAFLGGFFSLGAVIFIVLNFPLAAGATCALGGTALAGATVTAIVAKCFGIDGVESRIGRTLDGLFEQDDTVASKVGKVFFVISGMGGLVVIRDIGVNIKNYLFAAMRPVPSPSIARNRDTEIEHSVSQNRKRSTSCPQLHQFYKKKLENVGTLSTASPSTSPSSTATPNPTFLRSESCPNLSILNMFSPRDSIKKPPHNKGFQLNNIALKYN